MLSDRFGVPWMVSVAHDDEKKPSEVSPKERLRALDVPMPLDFDQPQAQPVHLFRESHREPVHALQVGLRLRDVDTAA